MSAEESKSQFASLDVADSKVIFLKSVKHTHTRKNKKK